MKITDPDAQQTGGWRGEGAGAGAGIHVREELLIPGSANPPICLVVKLFADVWVTTIELWRPEV